MQYPDTHLVVMGVAGSGKSNIEKMTEGISLQDEDRWPWLREIQGWMSAHAAAGKSTVLTCSALKQSYRKLLSEAQGRVLFSHLDGGADVIGQRMLGREGHFMPPTLLPSQMATLEPLTSDELAAGSLRLDISASPEEIVAAVMAGILFPPQAVISAC